MTLLQFRDGTQVNTTHITRLSITMADRPDAIAGPDLMWVVSLYYGKPAPLTFLYDAQRDAEAQYDSLAKKIDLVEA